MKALLGLCLLTALTSGYFGKAWHESRASKKAEAVKLTEEIDRAKRSMESLEQVLVADKNPMTLEETVSAALLEMFNQRVAHGVTVTNATPAKSGAGSMSELTTLAEEVPGSKLKSVRVTLTGNYSTYPGLVQYLKKLQELPVSLVYLKVQDQSFEASIRIFGVMKAS